MCSTFTEKRFHITWLRCQLYIFLWTKMYFSDSFRSEPLRVFSQVTLGGYLVQWKAVCNITTQEVMLRAALPQLGSVWRDGTELWSITHHFKPVLLAIRHVTYLYTYLFQQLIGKFRTNHSVRQSALQLCHMFHLLNVQH